MPVFPNINTLTPAQPAGNEYIQISATKRATLNDIASLALKLLGENVSYSFIKADSIGRVYLEGFVGYTYNSQRSQYEVVAIGFGVDDYQIYIGSTSRPTISLPSNLKPSEYLVSLIVEWQTIRTCDLMYSSSDSEITVNPGSQVYSYGTPYNIDFPKTSWNVPSEGANGKVYQASILSYGANITKSMFGAVGDDAAPVLNFIFSENFDEDPGTDYQLVAIQAYRVTSYQVIILVNKAGYGA